ncbi:MAG: sugar-binding protein [Candidatus Promineifilaceae bacterium]
MAWHASGKTESGLSTHGLQIGQAMADNGRNEEAMMGNQDDGFEDTWADLVPEQPGGLSRWTTWLLAGGISLAIICLCAAGTFLVAREFLATATPLPAPSVPTEPAVVEGSTAAATRPPTPNVLASPTLEVQPTVTLNQGPTAVPPPPTGNVDVVRLSASPTIDGQLTEWSAAPAYQSSFIVYSVAGWDGSDDLTATWRLAWDQQNLYIGVEITDDVHVQTQTGNQIFRGDSIDMQFDTDRSGDFGDGLSPDDYQITFSPGDFATLTPSAFRFRGTQAGQILDAPGHNINLQAIPTPTGYVLEAAIPWNDINVIPREGLVLGVALNANDNDTPGTAVQEVMKSQVETRTLTDPSGWGTLTLK